MSIATFLCADCFQDCSTAAADSRAARVILCRTPRAVSRHPVSDIGIPMTPSAELARDILGHLQTLSKPYGTNISIESNIGVIRVAPDETTK